MRAVPIPAVDFLAENDANPHEPRALHAASKAIYNKFCPCAKSGPSLLGSWASGIGRGPDGLLGPAELIEFDTSVCNVGEIQTRYRRAVRAFGPDYVVIRDA